MAIGHVTPSDSSPYSFQNCHVLFAWPLSETAPSIQYGFLFLDVWIKRRIRRSIIASICCGSNPGKNIIFVVFVRPHTKYRSDIGVELQDSLCLFVSTLRPVIGRHGSVWLYCFALIGQGTLRPPADLSRVRHPQVCPCTSVHCTEAGLNSCITVPSKVCAPRVSMKTSE